MDKEYLNSLEQLCKGSLRRVKIEPEIVNEHILLEAISMGDVVDRFGLYLENEMFDKYASLSEGDFNNYLEDMKKTLKNKEIFLSLMEGIMIGEVGISMAQTTGKTVKKTINLDKVRDQLEKKKADMAKKSDDLMRKAQDRFNLEKERIQSRGQRDSEKFDKYSGSVVKRTSNEPV